MKKTENRLHLIMPMGGAGSRFFKNGFVVPKPLIEISGKPFLYWAARSVADGLESVDLTFVVLQKHIDEFGIDKVILKHFPDACIVAVTDGEVHSGPVMTCLAGIRNIHDSFPVMFNDCDHMFRCNSFTSAVNSGEIEADAALLTFESDQPQFSYLRFDSAGKICGTVEKKVVSSQAICGAYYIRNAALFRTAAEQYLKECEYSEFFVSGIYNVMCRNGMTVKYFGTDFHVPFGTPDEYEAAAHSEYFKVFN